MLNIPVRFGAKRSNLEREVTQTESMIDTTKTTYITHVPNTLVTTLIYLYIETYIRYNLLNYEIQHYYMYEISGMDPGILVGRGGFFFQRQ